MEEEQRSAYCRRLLVLWCSLMIYLAYGFALRCDFREDTEGEDNSNDHQSKVKTTNQSHFNLL